nr:type II toxin-antitoxin system VapC family toxin [Kineosporia rhizophila]
MLDTHILLWWLTDNERLPAAMRKVIAEPDREVFVSAASAWEMSIKSALGKLDMPEGLREELDDEGITELAVTVEDGLAAGALPRHHDDPFDRMLIAQAARRDLLLLTADKRFSDYEVRLMYDLGICRRGVAGGSGWFVACLGLRAPVPSDAGTRRASYASLIP